MKPFALLVLALCSVVACPFCVHAAEGEGDADARLYVGIGVARLAFEDEFDGLSFDDVSTGIGTYAGFRLSERLSLEVSYDVADAINLGDVAGSGIVRFNVENERRTVGINVLREVSLRELLNWQRDWRLFGMAGIYRSDLDRTITTVGSNERTDNHERLAGALLGAGVIYRISSVEVRGYVRKSGVLDRGEAMETGASVQLRF
jgi:outer membrane protein with beta-barrel domain